VRNSIDKANGGEEIVKTHEKKFITLFIILALLSGWIGLLVDLALPEQPGEQTLGMGIWLVLPFLSGIATRVFRRDWKDFGIKPRLRENIRWYVLALLIFPAVTLLFTLIAWASGFATVSSFSASKLVPVMASIFVGLFIKNIFEDFAWQGYLTPKLVKTKMPDLQIYLVVGLVWAFWHAPYYLFFLPESFYSTPMDRVLDTFVFSPIVITIWAVMFVEMTRLTGSVWPAVLMHAVEDAVPNYLVFEEKLIQFTGAGDLLFSPVRGVLPLIAFLAFGLWLRKRRLEQDGEPILGD
jgi:membrane protease YdiL (CAAX protease family)